MCAWFQLCERERWSNKCLQYRACHQRRQTSHIDFAKIAPNEFRTVQTRWILVGPICWDPILSVRRNYFHELDSINGLQQKMTAKPRTDRPNNSIHSVELTSYSLGTAFSMTSAKLKFVVVCKKQSTPNGNKFVVILFHKFSLSLFRSLRFHFDFHFDHSHFFVRVCVSVAFHCHRSEHTCSVPRSRVSHILFLHLLLRRGYLPCVCSRAFGLSTVQREGIRFNFFLCMFPKTQTMEESSTNTFMRDFFVRSLSIFP